VPSGGARARSGPAANPNSARSEKRADGWTDLPAKGRGDRRAPNFPLGSPSKAESGLWTVLWKKPQATMWERLGLTFQVAAYARAFLESTVAGAPASLKVSVLRMEDGLGLSIVGLNALRWRIAEDEVAAARAAHAPVVPVEKPAPVRRLRSAG
jgi:hypothetical protein